MRHAYLSLLKPFWPAVLLLAGLMLAMSITSVQALPQGPDSLDTPVSPAQLPGGIQGTLYTPDGTAGVEGGWVDVYDEAGQPWMGSPSGPGGDFSIGNLPPGMYELTGYPPEGSPFASSLPVTVEVLSGEWSSATVFLTNVGVSGYVRDCDAVPEIRIPGAWVVVYDEAWEVEQWAETDANGEFRVGGVQEGSPYWVQAYPPEGSNYVPTAPISVTPIISNVVLQMCVPPMNVVGVVQDAGQNTIQDATVIVHRENYWDEAYTDEFGQFAFYGLPLGDFSLIATPPWDMQGLLPSAPISISITNLSATVDVGVLTLPRAFKTVTGWVTFEDGGQGVPDALVWASRLDDWGYAETGTNSSGQYTMSLSGGEWVIHTEPLTPAAANWLFPGPPAWIEFDLGPTEPETVTADLEVVRTDAWVTGRIVCPDGVPCDGQPFYEHDVWPGDIWIELQGESFSNEINPDEFYHFSLPIPAGWYELVIYLGHPWLQGPEPIPLFVNSGQTLNMGDVQLLVKDALITGQVRTETGQAVAHVPVVAWRPEGFGWGWTETDASGAYSLPVVSGEWLVEPEPGYEQPYVYTRRPRIVRLESGGVVEGINFVLASAGARIQGTALDSQSGERLWELDGWAWAERLISAGRLEFFSEAPMESGGFDLKAQGGHFYHVGVDLPPYAPYVSDSLGPFWVGAGEQVSVSIPMERKDAWIEGQVVIAGTGAPAVGVWAEVFGEDERGHWVNAGVDPHSAGYWADVVSGTWRLRAWVDPESGYVALPQPVTVTVPSGEGVYPVNFEVWPIASTLSGRVFDPYGEPLPGAFVYAEGESPHVGYFETYAESDPSGHFTLLVPEGTYAVGAVLPEGELKENGWLNPPPIEVPSPAAGLELRFRRLDGNIHGTVSFAPGITLSPTHPAYVWGWAESGEWVEAKADVVSGTDSFSYTLHVVSDTVWHVGAVYEDWENSVYFESPEAVVPVMPPSGQASQDLEMTGPYTLPQPLIVSFDAGQMQTIVMPDGVELSIPPGAIALSGTVTLYVFPTQEMRPEQGREVVGPGYEIWATDGYGREITRFNKNVVMTFHYPPDEVLRDKGVVESRLIPVYYSTLAGRWILADGYVLDTANNEIRLQLNHFSKFGMCSVEGPKEQNRIYLPVVIRGG